MAKQRVIFKTFTGYCECGENMELIMTYLDDSVFWCSTCGTVALVSNYPVQVTWRTVDKPKKKKKVL